MSFDNLNSALQQLDPYSGVFFIGTVKAVDDPKGVNRVRVEVPQLLEGPTDRLPWATPIKSAGIKSFGAPAVGDPVLVLLQNGNPHYPLYMGLMTASDPDFPNGSWGWKDQYGNKFVVGPGGKATWDLPNGIDINGNVKIKGNFDLQGNYSSTGTMTNNGKNVGAGHFHAVLAKDFGITSPPI